MAAEGDLAFTVTFETLPKFEVGSFDGIAIERPVAKVEDSDVEKALQSLAERSQEFETKTEGAKAAKGDKLTIDVLVLSVAGHRLCCLLTNRIRIMQRMVRPNSLVRWLA